MDAQGFHSIRACVCVCVCMGGEVKERLKQSFFIFK